MTHNTDTSVSVAHPVFKAITVWFAAFGITSWGEAASAIAFIYSLCLLGEWCWKRFIRGIAERYGIVKRKPRIARTRESDRE